MRYAALILLALVGLTLLITLFQNLLNVASYFSLLFWTVRVTPAIPLLTGFLGGVIMTLTLSVFLKSGNDGDDSWE